MTVHQIDVRWFPTTVARFLKERRVGRSKARERNHRPRGQL